MERKQIEWLLGQIDSEVEVLTSDIAQGRAADYADYKRGCGVILGYRRAKEYILKAIEDAEKEND